MSKFYRETRPSGDNFDVTKHVDFDANGRALCPVCSPGHKGNKKTLSLSKDKAYKNYFKCWRGCTYEDIREALGYPVSKQIPKNLAQAQQPKINEKFLVKTEKIAEAHKEMFNNKISSAKALEWLRLRGFSLETIAKYKLGMSRVKIANKMVYSIGIPIPSPLTDHYYIKKRVAPWDDEICDHEDYVPWKQYQIPATTYFTHLPEKATQTWLCEGEWDAIALAEYVSKHRDDVAVACFTCGCSALPSQDQLDMLPGEVIVFYDRNDKPTRQGIRPGEEGAKKVAKNLKDRCKIALVPMPKNSTIKGWDVSDALKEGYKLEDFERAACEAQPYKAEDYNSFLAKSRKLTELYDNAPDYVDWLVPGLFTANELFCLASEPRKGKSLFGLGLAKAVASGGKFLDRPCQQGDVAYICKEDPDDKVKERLIAQDWSRDEMQRVTVNNDFTLDDLPELIEYIKFAKPKLLILDTLSRIQRSNARENSSEIADVLAPLQDLAQQHNICVLVIHHTRKKNMDSVELDDIFDSVRGSGAIRATCRGMLVLASAKGQFRLAVENGRTATQDLQIRLDINCLSWKLQGRWFPPEVPMTQKQIVMDWIQSNGKGTIDDIYRATLIRKKLLYQILTRLINDNIIARIGRQESTVYYKVFSAQCPQDTPEEQESNCLDDRDCVAMSSSQVFLQKNLKHDHVSVQPNYRDHVTPPDHVFSEVLRTLDQKSQKPDTGATAHSDQGSENMILEDIETENPENMIRESVIMLGKTANTTTKHDQKHDQDEVITDEDKKLKAVWHKKHGFLIVLDHVSQRLRVRRSGERKSFDIYLRGCDSRREYKKHCEFDLYINYSLE